LTSTNGDFKGAKSTLLQETVASFGRAFIVVGLFSLCINLLMLTAPLYMLQVFDRVISSGSTDTLLMLMLVAGIALMTMSALEALRTVAMVRVSSWLDNKLGGTLLLGSLAATLNTRKDPSVQALRDLATVRTFLSGAGVFPIMDAPWTPIFLAVMFMLHPLMGWLSVIGAVFLFGLALANEISTRDLLMKSGGTSVAALRQAESSVRNADVIEAMGMAPSMVRRWATQNAKSLALQAQASLRSGNITAISKLLRMGLQIGIMSLGAWLTIKGELTAGAMIAGSILMGRALAPVEQAIGTWKQLVSARNAYDRVKAQLNSDLIGEPGMPLPAPKGNLSVEGVTFTYGGSKNPVLRNIRFDLAAGETLGLIGPTAVGKTTLARLLVGNLAPNLGHIRLDGMDVSDWNSDDLGKHIGYVPQDVELFFGTVNENIARMQEPDPEAVVAAAKKAGMHDMILHMDKGYDTQIGEGGAALSGGQRQRIALARALYGNPKFMVFDEPNSNLDSDGEKALLDSIRELKDQGATVIVIAHRPSVLQNVDKILVLGNGGVELFGLRDEVFAKLSGNSPLRVIEDNAPRQQGDLDDGDGDPPFRPSPSPAGTSGTSVTPETSPATEPGEDSPQRPDPQPNPIGEGVSAWGQPTKIRLEQRGPQSTSLRRAAANTAPTESSDSEVSKSETEPGAASARASADTERKDGANSDDAVTNVPKSRKRATASNSSTGKKPATKPKKAKAQTKKPKSAAKQPAKPKQRGRKSTRTKAGDA
jgi:ATP-binding cassette subfamily B protein/ATP-binding cassette subfamily C protein